MGEAWPLLGDHWLPALCYVVPVAGLGALTGWGCFRVFGIDKKGITTWTQRIAIGLLLWATFGHAGWAIHRGG